MNLTELTPENKKGYKDMKKSFNDFLDDYYEYLQIISEFKTNEYLQNIHNDIVIETCKTRLFNNDSLSLYVLTIRELVNRIKLLNDKADDTVLFNRMEKYRTMYENTRDELNETKKKLEEIQKIVNRGDTSE